MKCVIIIIVTFMCITTMAFGGNALPPDGWRFPLHLVDQSSSNQTEPDVASKGDSVFIAWIDARGIANEVYFKRSFNKGFSWLSDVSITGSANVSRHVNIAIAENSGMIYLLWTSGTNPYALKFVRSTNRGGEWQTVVPLASNLQKEPCGSINVDGDGDIHIAYYKKTSTCDSLIYLHSTDQGQNFSTDQVYYTGGNVIFGTSITVVFNNSQPHIVFLRDDGSHATFYHTYKAPLGNWTSPQTLDDDCYTNDDCYYTLDLISDMNDSLHLCFQGYQYPQLYVGGIRYTQCNYTLQNGWAWRDSLDTLHLENGTHHPSIVAYGSNLQVVYQAYGGYGKLYYSLSTDLGDTWTVWNGNKSRLLWAYNQHQSPYYCYYPSISAGTNERHVVFNSSGATDIYYLANDDLLLSSTSEATAYNGGRHLWRDETQLKKAHLHLVYFSQGRPHYTASTNGGTTWSPYHILENTLYGSGTPKDSGYYPTVGLIPKATGMPPYVIYIDNENQVVYRYRKTTGEWGGFPILSTSNYYGDPGPPSAVTYGTVTDGDSIYVAFSVAHSNPDTSAIFFCQFKYDYAASVSIDTVEKVPSLDLKDSKVSITIDGNRNPHVVWSKKGGSYYDIFYRWRNSSGTWAPSIYNVSSQPDSTSVYPHIDDWGPNLAVVWHNEVSGSPDNVWRRENQSGSWQSKALYSGVSGASAMPVNASVYFTVWCLQGLLTNFDIYYKNETPDSGWVSNAIPKEYFCHSQLQRDQTPWELFTIFTKGNAIPYRIVAVNQQFDLRGFTNNCPLYTVETGEDTASVFCVQRDATITYEGYSVDYADKELIYDLSYLEPIFPYHLIRGTMYFEGTGNKTHEIWINGKKKLTLEVNANQPFDFELPIPCELYQNKYRVTLSIKNPEASGAYLAGLDVCRLTEDQYGGGTQSTGTCELKSKNQMFLTPNPFSKTLNIKLQTPEQDEASLKIYDITGRLVKQFSRLTRYAQRPTLISWDGCDDTGARLPNGIYFLELETGDESITRKVIMLK